MRTSATAASTVNQCYSRPLATVMPLRSINGYNVTYSCLTTPSVNQTIVSCTNETQCGVSQDACCMSTRVTFTGATTPTEVDNRVCVPATYLVRGENVTLTLSDSRASYIASHTCDRAHNVVLTSLLGGANAVYFSMSMIMAIIALFAY